MNIIKQYKKADLGGGASQKYIKVLWKMGYRVSLSSSPQNDMTLDPYIFNIDLDWGCVLLPFSRNCPSLN